MNDEVISQLALLDLDWALADPPRRAGTANHAAKLGLGALV
jgi:hypothetical protein